MYIQHSRGKMYPAHPIYERPQECSIPPLMIGMSDEGMSWGGNGGSTSRVGFRFYPRDEELINHYLKLKLQGRDSEVANIAEVDLLKWEPWQLPGFSVMKTNDPEWFFFSLVDYKFSKGSRLQRATKAGYWKPTGQDYKIKSGSNKIGTKKTLVYYRGRGRAAERTNWVIHEYRADIAGLHYDSSYVLCRLKRNDDENSEYGATHYSSNYQGDDQVLALDEDLQLMLNDNTFTPLDSDSLLFNSEQGLELDIPPSLSPRSMQYGGGYEMNFADSMQYGGGYEMNFADSMQYGGGYEMNFADSLIIDPDEYRF